MDYPKSVPGIGLVNGKFVDENITNGRQGSLIPSDWGNSLTDEVLNVIQAGELEPSEMERDQLLKAIRAIVEKRLNDTSALPIGSMVPFPVGVVPSGFLEVDGRVLSIACYPDLAAYLGTTFNVGDEGAGNFRLPDSRGEFFRGWANTRDVDAGRVLGSNQLDEFKSHSHRTGMGYLKHGADVLDGSTLPLKSTTNSNVIIDAVGGTETRPRNLAVMWCIKAWSAPINQGHIDIAELAASIPLVVPLHYLAGFGMSLNAAAPTTTVDVAPGQARSVGNPVTLNAPMSGVLQLAGGWAAGYGANKLDAGVRAANTWYHAFVIRKLVGSAGDLLFSTSLTGPVVPVGYEVIRRIGSIRTDANGLIMAFIMDVFIGGARRFRWATPVRDALDAAVTTTASTLALTVPPGLEVEAEMSLWLYTNNILAYFSPLDTADLAIASGSVSGTMTGYTAGYGSVTGDAIDSCGFKLEVRTDKSAQIRARANLAGKYSMLTLGWWE